jgi:hypothetical protein
MQRKRLGVTIDGSPLAEAEAHALWDRFSYWMDQHRGDLKGFATQEGFASVHPGVDGETPVLRASRTVAQKAYAPVRAEDSKAPGGSPERHPDLPLPARRSTPLRKLPKKRGR